MWLYLGWGEREQKRWKKQGGSGDGREKRMRVGGAGKRGEDGKG